MGIIFHDRSLFSSARHQVTVGDLDDDIFQSEVTGLGLVHDQVNRRVISRDQPLRGNAPSVCLAEPNGLGVNFQSKFQGRQNSTGNDQPHNAILRMQALLYTDVSYKPILFGS